MHLQCIAHVALTEFIHIAVKILFEKFTGAPIFASKTNNVTVLIGNDASIKIDICAGPNPSISWSRRTFSGDESVPGSHNHIHVEGTRLVFDHVYADDIGIYTCIVANSFGQTQDVIFVTVISKYARCMSN